MTTLVANTWSMMAALPVTGQTIPLWIPIAGAALLIGGVLAVLVPALLRRRKRSDDVSE